jgi:hypothetical protein
MLYHIKTINIFKFLATALLMLTFYSEAQVTATCAANHQCQSITSFSDCGSDIYKATITSNINDYTKVIIKVNGDHIRCLGYSKTGFSWENWINSCGKPGSQQKSSTVSPTHYIKINTASKTAELTTSNFSCEVVLPVELIKFDVKAEGCGANLTWSTASEINNDFFIVEYSYDGTDWKEIDNAKVSGAGNSSEVIDYSFYDFDCSHNRLVYYRIVQVDFDGTRTNSVVKSLNLGKPKLVKVYPNPTKGYITIDVNLELGDKTGNLVVKTIAGQKVFSKAIVNGKNEFDLSKFSPDTYIIKVSSENQLTYYEKLIIIK